MFDAVHMKSRTKFKFDTGTQSKKNDKPAILHRIKWLEYNVLGTSGDWTDRADKQTDKTEKCGQIENKRLGYVKTTSRKMLLRFCHKWKGLKLILFEYFAMILH